MNILITAAGRRTSLVKAFVEATRPDGGIVVAGDVDPLAPALDTADVAERLPPVTDPAYLDALTEVVERHRIGLVVPTIDTELALLANAAAATALRRARVVISSPGFIAITGDKAETGRVFAEAGIETPRSWLPPTTNTKLPAELIVKPRDGSASQSVVRIRRDDVDAAIRLVPFPIIQEVLDGPEITIDALLGFDGTAIHYVPRRRIKTLGGESIQGVTLARDADLERWIGAVLAVCADHGAIGPMTVQCFLTERGPILTEINARFGGGFPLTRAAGGDYPRWLIALAEGRDVEPRIGQYEAGLFMTRTLVERFLHQPAW